MKKKFIEKLLAFFKKAEGLPEAIYDDKNVTIVNWPKGFQREYYEMVQQIGDGWTDDDFLEFAVWWELYKNEKVPRGIILSVTKCFYDNPNKPSLKKVYDEVEKERARRALN